MCCGLDHYTSSDLKHTATARRVWRGDEVVWRLAVSRFPNIGRPVNLRERTLGVGMRRRFQARVDQMNLPRGPVDPAPVSDKDIATLPSPARRYLEFMGVVGRPPRLVVPCPLRW